MDVFGAQWRALIGDRVLIREMAGHSYVTFGAQWRALIGDTVLIRDGTGHTNVSLELNGEPLLVTGCFFGTRRDTYDCFGAQWMVLTAHSGRDAYSFFLHKHLHAHVEFV